MTRKCIMCKGKNYKNTCSFFSAPKDPEARRLWQAAINIKDYIVNDETYVCSKHFEKNDIITHWVSGIPPQVITIKYKKCRLRRGAVPIPISSSNNLQDRVSVHLRDDEIVLDNKILMEHDMKAINSTSKIHDSGRTMNDSLNCNLEDEIYEYIPEDSQEPEESENEIISNEMSKRQKLMHNNTPVNKQISYSINQNGEILYIDCTNLKSADIEDRDNNIQFCIDNAHSILTYYPKRSKNIEKEFFRTKSSFMQKNESTANSSINWQVKGLRGNIKMNEIEEFRTKSHRDGFPQPNESICEVSDFHNTVFRDFLQIYNEVSLPNSWFASVIHKNGHATTIVYCCMKISNSGMPFIEKEVFFNCEMTLRCGVLNKEIDTTSFSNLQKSLNVITIQDVENFIKEFDHMSICTGILDKNFADNRNSHVIIFDGNTWRHCSCPMILNNGQLRCFNCTSLMADSVHSQEEITNK